jgi:hypothetical protein
LYGEKLTTVIAPDSTDDERGGPFYGNIGRCLQFMGQTDAALVCYQKSALLVERRDTAEVVLNQGYIRYWIAEVLLACGERDLAAKFFLAAYGKWRQASPPKAEKAWFVFHELQTGNTLDDEASQRTAETTCLEWIYGNKNEKARSNKVAAGQD